MTVAYFVGTIVLLVVIHEWGHFAFARFFGVGVRSFTVGFGRSFISWVDPKTGTRWGVAPYLLGGYVGLLDDVNASNTNINVSGKSFVLAPLHAKLLILFAGPFVNVLFAALIYSILAYCAPNPATPVLAKPPLGSAAEIAGLQSGDVLSRINGVEVANWRQVQIELLKSSIEPSVTINIVGSNKQKNLPISKIEAEQLQDEMLGLRLYSKGLRLEALAPEGAAAKAGMRVDDVMVRVNGQVIDHPDVLLAALRAYQPSSLFIEIMLERAGQTLIIFVRPLLEEKTYRLGIKFEGLPQLSPQNVNWNEALQNGTNTAYTACLLTAKGLGIFLLKPFNSEQLAGPISIAKTAKASADRGWMAALGFIASLSISVGVLNLLPIPLLDGGQIVFHSLKSMLETLGLSFKLKTSEQLNRWWVSCGFAFVVSLTLSAFFADFKRWFAF